MSPLPIPGDATITVKHPFQTDRNGDPIPNSAAADTVVPGCLIAPNQSTENMQLQDLVDSNVVLWAPAGTVLAVTDRVVLPNYPGEWQVDGSPNRWDATGFTWPPGTPSPGVEAVLRQVR